MAGILFPTDFSPASDNALEFAIEMAKRNHARIVLLHAYQVHAFDANSLAPEITVQAFHEAVTKKLEALKTELLSRHLMNIEICASFGFTVDAIEQGTQDFDIDFVMLGTTGSSSLENKLLGSTTADCIARLKKPVMAIPLNAQFRGMDKIIFASALHKDELPALEKLNEMLQHFGAEVTVAHIFSGDDKQAMEFSIFQELADAKLFNCKTHFRQFSGNVIDGIEQSIRFQKTDLLAMVTHHRNFFEKIFDKSLTKKMALHTDVPLIAFQAE